MSKKRVGVFGGSFSPPHKGHIHAAEIFIESEKLDVLYILPAYLSPGKSGYGNVTPEDRFRMCELAFSHLPSVKVLDIELKRGGNSYTADTLTALAREDEELLVLCGTDTALALDSWYKPEVLFRLAQFVMMPREDNPDLPSLLSDKNKQYQALYGGQVRVLKTDKAPIPVSSTAVRASIMAGQTENLPLTDGVLAYIQAHRLYMS